jgi:hypothetical protein
MTDRPAPERDTAAWGDFDPPDSTQDWIANTRPPTGPSPQRDNEAGQPFSRQPLWESDPSRTLFGDRSNPHADVPPPGPPPPDAAPPRPAEESDRPPQANGPGAARPPAPGQPWPGSQAPGQQPPPQQFGHSYTERIRSADLVPKRKRAPSGGWRRLVFKASFGLINPGPSAVQIRQAELEAKIRSVLRGHYKVGVMGKGGVGKTTVAASLGSVFAEVRQDVRVVAIDADTSFGKLGNRIDPKAVLGLDRRTRFTVLYRSAQPVGQQRRRTARTGGRARPGATARG